MQYKFYDNREVNRECGYYGGSGIGGVEE